MEAKATCGQSSKTKSREIVQKAAYGGKECEGFAMESELVQLEPCPSKFMNLVCKIVPMKYHSKECFEHQLTYISYVI